MRIDKREMLEVMVVIGLDSMLDKWYRISKGQNGLVVVPRISNQSGTSNVVAVKAEVGTTFTGSGNLYCQWELSPGSENALCILFPTQVTIVRQTKNLHKADFIQIYNFLKMNQDEVNELRAKRLAKYHDPLALMAHSQSSHNLPTTHKDQSSSSTHPQQSFPINNKIDKLRMLEEMVGISLDSMLDNWHRISKGIMHGRMVDFKSGSGNVVAARVEGTGMGNQARCYNCRGLGDLDKIKEVNANCILMANLQQASTSGTQHDNAPVYDTNGSAEYTDLLEPIPEPQLVPQNENHVTSVAPIMVQSGGTVETSFAPNEETRAHQETVYQHDPPAMYDSEETLELAQDSHEKMKFLKKEIKPANYAKINHLSGKLELKIVELEFQVVNYEREISHLKTTYKNLFDSIKSNQAHAKLHDLIFENAKLRARLFENTSESLKNTSGTSVTPHVDKPKLSVVTPYSKKLHASNQSHYVPQPREFNVMKHRNVIAPGMFKINPSQMPRENVSSNTVTTSSTGLVHIAGTRRPQPKGSTRNARIPSASKSSEVKKIVSVEDHRRTLLLSKNRKTMSSECNNIKLATRNDKSEIVCDTCKQCLVTANHDACLLSSVNALNSRANKLCANVPPSANQKRHRIQVWKPKQVGSKERLAPKPRLPRFSLKWSPSGRSFDLKGN
nr:ribonuclease H-like domain-containing protein [Tanacetum cinerariifolium]